jgi:hypothetical protein
MNLIKQDQGLWVSQSTARLSLSPDFIGDLAPTTNRINEISSADPQVSIAPFGQDVTSPTLRGVHLNMDIGVLTLTFRETVDLSTVTFAEIGLQATPSAASESVRRNLTGGVVSPSSPDSTFVRIELLPADLNNIKWDRFALTGSSDAFITLTSLALTDQNARPVNAIPNGNAFEVTQFTPDVSGPSVSDCVLSLKDGDDDFLTIYFNETIDVHNMNVSAIVVTSRPGVPGHRLTDSEVERVSEDGTVVKIALSFYDESRIKIAEPIASPTVPTVSIDGGTATHPGFLDVSGNTIVNTVDFSVNFETDETPPEIVSFSLDLSTEILTVSFNEVISYHSDVYDVSTIIMRHLVVHNTSAYPDPGCVTSPLNEGTVCSPGSYVPKHYVSDEVESPVTRSWDGLTLFIRLNPFDVDAIKLDRSLGVDTGTTYMSILENPVHQNGQTGQARPFVDMQGLPVVPFVGMPASVLTPDTVRPALESFTFNLTTEILTLSFSEAVDAQTFDVETLVFHSHDPSLDSSGSGGDPDFSGSGDAMWDASEHPDAQYYALTASSTVLPVNAAELYVSVGVDDLNVIKNMTNLAISKESTILEVVAGTVKDMNANRLAHSAFGAQALGPDATRPELLSFDLNLTSEILALTFSETVDASTVALAAIVVANGPTNAARGIPLTENSTVAAGDGGLTDGLYDSNILAILVGTLDLDRLKLWSDIATTRTNTLLHLGNDVVRDMAGNRLVEVVQTATDFFGDRIAPQLMAFDIDMDTATVTMTFDEVIKNDQFVSTRLEFLDSSGSDVIDETGERGRHQLRGGTLAPGDGTVLTFVIDHDDLNEMKRKDVCYSAGECRLRLDADAVRDMNMVPNAVVDDSSATDVTLYDQDSVRPELLKFELDMNSSASRAALTLFFDEPVRTRLLDPTQIIMQHFHTRESGLYRPLTSDCSTNGLNSMTVLLHLSIDDSNELKKN